MADTIRVAYLCEFPTLLGGERSLLQFLRCCGGVGIEPVVIAPKAGPLADAVQRMGLPIVPWDPRQRRYDILSSELRCRDIEIFHGNSLMMGDAVQALGTGLGIPTVTHVRDIMSLSAARIDRLRSVDAVLGVSNAVRDWLIAIGLTEDRVHAIPNGVDIEHLMELAQGPDLRDELGVASSTQLIGCIGQISLRKGQDTFLEAARQVASAKENVCFVVVGERFSQKNESLEYDAKLHEMATTPELRGRVQFLGYRNDVPRILRNLDIVVVPSRQEPLSRVLLEALAVGTPAIATNVGGSSEVLNEGRFGTLVPADEPFELAEAILNLLGQRTLRRMLSDRGREYARTYFDPSLQAQRIRAVYDNLL